MLQFYQLHLNKADFLKYESYFNKKVYSNFYFNYPYYSQDRDQIWLPWIEQLSGYWVAFLD